MPDGTSRRYGQEEHGLGAGAWIMTNRHRVSRGGHVGAPWSETCQNQQPHDSDDRCESECNTADDHGDSKDLLPHSAHHHSPFSTVLLAGHRAPRSRMSRTNSPYEPSGSGGGSRESATSLAMWSAWTSGSRRSTHSHPRWSRMTMDSRISTSLRTIPRMIGSIFTVGPLSREVACAAPMPSTRAACRRR